jgi:hypothetical protein
MFLLFTAFRIVLRTCFVALLVLGLLFWTGHGITLIPLHMAIGFVLVVTLWAIAIAGALRGAPLPLAGIAILWGFLVPWLGQSQFGLLPGPWHWVIQVLHLFVGIVAVGLGERIIALRRQASAAN